MQPLSDQNRLYHLEHAARFMEKVRAFYARMDQKYTEVSNHYGFNCQGCDENCCQTRFYHHTFQEYLYLKAGYNQLGEEKKRVITQRARNVEQEASLLENSGEPVRLMCPLNFKGACILYAYRPMICRLHGIPHELQKPGDRLMKSPGC